MALALASTARVADSAILPTRVETRRAGGVGVMDAMFPDSAHPVGTGQPGSRGSDWVNWTLARTLVALGRPDACPCMPGASFSGWQRSGRGRSGVSLADTKGCSS